MLDFAVPFVALAVALPLDGPAVITHDIPSATAFGTLNGERSYAAGGVWCNLGDQPAVWDGTTVHHPVTATNLYRIEGGVLEQIGASWAWHHVCALQQAVCATCTPAGSGCPGALGVGCSNTSSAAALGTQSNMSRRSDVNPATGDLVFPFSGPSLTGLLDRRCRVAVDDVTAASHPGAIYLFESATIHPSQSNPSARYATRRVNPTSLLGTPTFMAAADDASTAIDFWKSIEPSLTVVTLDLAGDGRVVVAGRVAPLPRGGWRYDYAIENVNSLEAIGAFSIPVPVGASATNLRFHAPLAHSGEVTSNDPWTGTVGNGAVQWTTQTYPTNPLANAVRWGTTYTFGFNSDRAPGMGVATLTRFMSGATATLVLPMPSVSNPDLNTDGFVDSEDLAILLGAWGSCNACPADLDGDNTVDSTDLAILLGAWTI